MSDYNLLCIFLTVVIFIVMVILQMFLSKKKNKWLGLIIPSIHFLMAIAFALLLTTTAIGIEEVVMENGEIIENVSGSTDLGVMIFSAICTFLLFNISTFIHLRIYFAYKRLTKKHN